jgi:hypothetical protein
MQFGGLCGSCTHAMGLAWLKYNMLSWHGQKTELANDMMVNTPCHNSMHAKNW